MRRVEPKCATAALLPMVLACSACGPSNYYVPGMKIDSERHLIPVGSRTLDKPPTNSYFYFFYTATGLTIVTHWEKAAGTPDFHKVLYLETNKNNVLDRTVREDDVLTGDFGTLVASRTCFHARPIAEGWSGMAVHIESNQYPTAQERPLELAGPPRDVPALTSVSLVRIFRAAPEFVVVSANYEASGALGTLNLGATLGGERQPGSSTRSHVSPDDPDLVKYGIPRQIDIGSYVRSRNFPLPKVDLPQEKALVILHYGFGKFMREDMLNGNAIVSSRFLQPIVTDEERLLDPECDERFRRQQATGLPTTFTSD